MTSTEEPATARAPAQAAREALEAAIRERVTVDCLVDDTCPRCERQTARLMALADAYARAAVAAKTAGQVPGSGAGEMRAVIDVIWRMCQQPGRNPAARIAGLIKNSGMEPF